jgi:hypothetical protein
MGFSDNSALSRANTATIFVADPQRDQKVLVGRTLLARSISA